MSHVLPLLRACPILNNTEIEFLRIKPMRKIPFKDVEEEILTLVKYQENEPKNPYILDLKNRKQELFLYGCKHSRNIRNKQFKQIEGQFNDFLRRNRNSAIIIEGPRPDILSKEELVRKYTEGGFVFYLSHRKGIKVHEIEPSWDQLLGFAIKRNSKISVASWILLNTLNNRIKAGSKFDKKSVAHIKSLLASINEKLHFSKADHPFEEISIYLNDVAGKVILPKNSMELMGFNLNPQYIFKLQDPFSSKTAVNKVGTDINLGRDYFLSKNILKVLESGKSVFCVLGLNHVFCTKKVFKNFFQKK